MPREPDLPARQDRRAGAARRTPQQFAASEANAEVGRADAAGRAHPGRRRGAGARTPRPPPRCGSATSSSPCPGAPVDSPRRGGRGAAPAPPRASRSTVTYRRDGQAADADVVLAARARTAPQGLLGVRPGVGAAAGDIRISLGDIGGPSAGPDVRAGGGRQADPGELTGGRFVAGTGTITRTARSAPIGGIPFKMRGRPRRRAPRCSSCPDDNCAEAAATAPDGPAAGPGGDAGRRRRRAGGARRRHAGRRPADRRRADRSTRTFRPPTGTPHAVRRVG